MPKDNSDWVIYIVQFDGDRWGGSARKGNITIIDNGSCGDRLEAEQWLKNVADKITQMEWGHW
jgi:hypothetical protein